jgi:acyl-CoA synthetase (AMP-forming)/AMP-acid ligase II
MESHSRQFAAFPAVIEPGQSQLTYAELWRKVIAVEAALSALGVQPGGCVATILANGAEFLATMLGVSRYCACAPVNPFLEGAELEEILRRIRPAAIVLMDGPGSAKHRRAAEKFGVPVVAARELHSAPTIAFNHKKKGASLSRMKMFSTEVTKGASRTAFILATSATTGRAKLATHSQASVSASTTSICEALQLSNGDRALLLCPAFHILGLSSALAQWMAGGAVIAPRQFEAAAFSQWIASYDTSWYAAVPATHSAVLHHLNSFPLSRKNTLRFVCSGDTPLTPGLAAELSRKLSAAVVNTYGMTETGPLACSIAADFPSQMPIAEDRSATVRFVGKSIGPEIAIMDPDHSLLGAGRTGEIVVRGKMNCTGYLDDPEATAGAFHDGWFRTGDLGWKDKMHNLFLLGSIKEVIYKGEEMILPHEVEAVLDSHLNVYKSVAFAIPHASLGEDLVCAVALREGATLDEDELRGYALGNLSHSKAPSRVYFIDEIPHTLSGKPQRRLAAETIRRIREAAATDGWDA